MRVGGPGGTRRSALKGDLDAKNLDRLAGEHPTQQQQQLAAIMKSYWTNFARRGFPTSFGTPFWLHFNNVTQQIQSLVPPMPQPETNFAATRKCAFWAAG